MGSSRKHKEKDGKRVKDSKHRDRDEEKRVSRETSKEREREKTDKSDKTDKTDKTDKADKPVSNTEKSSHRSSHRHRDKEGSSSRKRARDSSDEDLSTTGKKSKVKEESKYKTSSNKVKLEETNFADNDRNRRDVQTNKNVFSSESVKTESNSESLSIDETNKLRIKLGLKPLQVDDNDGSKKSENSKDDTKNKEEIPKPKEVFVKTESISAKLEAEKIRQRIVTQREKRKIQENLKRVKKLTEDDYDVDDSTSWVQKSRKIQEEKERAAKRAKVLEEMDVEFGVNSLIDEDIRATKEKAYTSKHLKGLTIGHKEDEFKEGQQIVLTLKDSEVLNEEHEDVLENVNLIDNEKAQKNIENKLKKPDYNPYDEPEFDEFGILKNKTLLSKYDEEIDGPKKEAFKIGVTALDKQQEMELIRLKLKQQESKISLDTYQPKLISEYYTQEEMEKFKKPKKVRKILRKKDDKDFDAINLNSLEANTSSSDHGSRKNKANAQNDINSNQSSIKKIVIKELKEELIDDIDMIEEDIHATTDIVLEEDEAEKELQHALHKARKLKQREDSTETTGAASIVKVAKLVKTFPSDDIDETQPKSPTLPQTISGNIILNSTAEFCRNLGDIPTYGMAGNRDEDEDLIEFDDDFEERQNPIDPENNRGTWNEVELMDDNQNSIEESEGQPILEEEPDVSVGLAGALKLAMKKGYLDKEVKKQVSAPRHSLLQAQSYTIEEKFYEDDKVGRRERYNGPVSDFREKDTYRPEIKLDYVDEKGRVLDQKEAFRHLSHKFHGKGPGKNKIDKRMKKKEQDSKLRQMSSTDTPLNTLKMLQEKQKELQSPFIVLTGHKSLIQPTISKFKQ